MTSINIEELFNENRFSTTVSLFVCFFYFPIGIILVVLRCFIGIHTYLVACILPQTSFVRCFVLRVMCGILGIFVSVKDAGRCDESCRILVSNYSSVLDHVAIGLIVPNVTPNVWSLPSPLARLLRYREMGVEQGRDALIENVKQYCQSSSIPLLAFPEGSTTNGHVGLLKFSVWPFSLRRSVQPVSVEVCRPPLLSISVSVLDSHFWSDIFWFLFVPYTHFRLRFLPSESQSTDEDAQEFARRVQLLIAQSLSVERTAFTGADKAELLKRKAHKSSITDTGQRNTKSTTISREMQLMIDQVHGVLLHVPPDVIMSDLAMTKDVDLTITNILEGRVKFTPKQPSVAAEKTPEKTTPQPTTTNVPKMFHKNYQDRQLSLEERKKALYEQARLRYAAKHDIAL